MNNGRFVVFTLTTLAMLVTVFGAVSALAQTEIVLYSFGNAPDGSDPIGGLVRDYQGNLYGTTYGGGSANGGTVFKLAPSGREYILHNFTFRPDGAYPIGDLARDKNGVLYGTTNKGGSSGYGTVFEVVPPGHEKVLHSFGPEPDGEAPTGGVILDASGNIYGTTSGGGIGLGTVFEISGGIETLVYTFNSNFVGSTPLGALYRDPSGNLYGSTCCGGTNLIGSVFAITPSGQEKWLYSFGYGGDGDLPFSSVVGDRLGNIYGTTDGGGAHDNGTIFKIDSTGAETILYSFTGGDGGTDPARGVVLDPAGNIYGIARSGGTYDQGIVYMLSPGGTFTVLHAFSGTPDGAQPNSDLFRDPATGFLYGTTSIGGANGNGTVYEVIP